MVDNQSLSLSQSLFLSFFRRMRDYLFRGSLLYCGYRLNTIRSIKGMVALLSLNPRKVASRWSLRRLPIFSLVAWNLTRTVFIAEAIGFVGSLVLCVSCYGWLRLNARSKSKDGLFRPKKFGTYGK
jgi:uncharacterized membrane protein